jgi:flagellar protein FlgJ
MLDGQLAQLVSGKPGGLADVLARQLSRHMTGGADAADGARPAANAPAGEPATLRRASSRTPAAAISTIGGLPPALASALGARSPRADAVSGTPAAMAADGKPALRTADLRAGEPPRSGSPAQVAFVGEMYPHARAAERETGVPAEFIVGQAALESGWGRGEMRHADGSPAHNLFGIKAGASWTGRTVDVLTTEYIDGKPRKLVETFRAYDSYADAFTDWARLMTRSSRYGEVVRAGHSPEAFATGLQRAGYATDPNYARKLEQVIERTIELRRPRT